MNETNQMNQSTRPACLAPLPHPPPEVVTVEPQAKEVTVKTHSHDKYKRTIADVLLPDGTNVNHTLVKDRWC
jgi:hypothetical protein